MELFDEEINQNKNTDNKRTTTVIIALIIFLIIVVVALGITIVYLKGSTLKVRLNGEVSNGIKNMLVIDENNQVYVPIRKIASYLGYNSYNGDYVTKSEESNQCYVECENEVAMFALNSKTIYKIRPGQESNYEYFEIDEKVFADNNELYTTKEGIEKAFNVSWDYDVENKTMTIYTMPYLITVYSNRVLNYGYDKVSEDFTNQKAVLEDMLVVERSGNNGTQVGVINPSTGDAILEAKYQGIEYLQHTSDFLVSVDGKKGIISKNKRTKVQLQYDNIELMDYKTGLYAVTKSNRKGIIDFKGNIVVNLDYEAIGVDIDKFKENNIRSKYILAGSLIPMRSNNLWGFFDTKGNQITECKYDSIGYAAANNQAGYNLLVVPDYNVIVVEKGSKYTVITTSGKEIWPFAFDSIYIEKSGGQTYYKMDYNGQALDLIAYLDNEGYGKKKNSNSSNNSKNSQTEQQDEEVEEQTEENEQYSNEQQNDSEEENQEEQYNN